MKKWTKIIIGTLIALFLVCGGGWLYLRSQVYQASRSAEVASQSAVETQSGLDFLSKSEKGPAVIFYPGALVSPASYSIWPDKSLRLVIRFILSDFRSTWQFFHPIVPARFN